MAGILRRTNWRKLLYTIGIVFGVGLLAYQTWRGYLAIQQVQLCVVRPLSVIGLLGLYIAAYIVQMVAWAVIMRSLQAPLSPNAVLKGYMISFLPRYIPGTVWGYLSRNEWLAQNHNISYGVSTVASLLEAGLLLLVAITLGAMYWVDTVWKVPVALAGLVAVGVAWILVPWFAARFGGKRVQISPKRVQSAPLGVLTAALYLLFWGLQGIAVLYIGAMLCAEAPISLFAGTAAISLAWALGFVILFVPAGIGIREWSLGALLVAFSGLEPGQAAIVAVISRVAVIGAEIVVLLVGLQRYFRGGRK